MSETKYRLATTVVVGEQTIEFARLSWKELQRLGEKLKADKQSQVEKLAGKLGIVNYDQSEALATIAIQHIPVGEIESYANSPEGAADILTRSLKLTGKSDTEAADIIDQMDIRDAVVVAYALVAHLPLKTKPAESPKNAESPA